MLKYLLALAVTCLFYSVHAIEKYPVDICFMIADLKYNSKQGVKICEIQHGSLSLFKGDKYRNLEEESIYNEFLHTFALYNENGWVVTSGIKDKNLVSTLTESSFWQGRADITSVLSDPHFLSQARKSPKDIDDLSSYQGFLYANKSGLRTIADFEKKFPGVVIIDKSSFPFWVDKYKMTQLFAEDELLATFKPKWGCYEKNYTKELASKIASDLQCDTFVIKPRGRFLGKGVIITSQEDLDETLLCIINKTGKFANSQDPAYTAWIEDPFDNFIVEEFVASDLIVIPHLENKVYQPTMRIAFVLVYNKHCHHVHFLGGYWKTPEFSISENASFMEKNKDICEPPYYCYVDPQTMQLVQDELRIALPLLHRQMLQFQRGEQ